MLQQAFPDLVWLAECLEVDSTHPQRQSEDDYEEDLDPVPNTRASSRMAQATNTIKKDKSAKDKRGKKDAESELAAQGATAGRSSIRASYVPGVVLTSGHLNYV